MLRRDARAMATAARQITGQPVSAASIKALNEQLGFVADDELVEAVARFSR